MQTENTVEATLKAWQAQLEDVRRRRVERGGGQAGLAKPQQVIGKSGLEVMTALLEGELPHPYMADTFDCELIEVGDGLAVFQATPQLKHYNPLGSVHGGWYATLLDFALGCAVQTKLPEDIGYTTNMRMQQRRVPFSLLMPHIPSESILMIGIDPTRCPICHEPNVCAMEKAKATGTKPERCWCMDAVFTPAVMDQVPDSAKGKACVCAKCAAEGA